jgi:hypothetical protein
MKRHGVCGSVRGPNSPTRRWQADSVPPARLITGRMVEVTDMAALAIVKLQGGKVRVTGHPDGDKDFANAMAALEFMTAETERLAAAAAQKETSKGISVVPFLKGEKTTYNGVESERKGNIGVRGLQRMPLTLFPAQWRRLFTETQAEIAGVILVNADKLDWKSTSERESTMAWARSVTEQAGNAGQATDSAASE